MNSKSSISGLTIGVVVVAALIALPSYDPAVEFTTIPRTNHQTAATKAVDAHEYTREVVYFPCSGLKCEAWLYMPKLAGAGRPPVVLLGHGMGSQKDMGLDKYASSFVKSGVAAFVFDYRTFGGSDGEPRNWVSPSRHVQDWLSAVKYVREQLADRVDGGRMGLWGTSFAGGHVLTVASQTPNIGVVISQVPHLDARVATKASIKTRGLLQSVRVMVAALHDKLRTSLGFTPAYIPLAGPPGSLAIMQLSEFDHKEWKSKHPSVYQGGWQNLARASFYLEMLISKYSPIKFIPSIQAPIMFIAATNDGLCPHDVVEAASRLAPNGRLLSLTATHFELYRGALFEGMIHEQVAFLQRHLGVDNAAAAGAGEAAAEDGVEGAAAAAAHEAEVVV